MRIMLDARYLSRNYSGIGIYSQRLIEQLSRLDRENEYVCLVHEDFNRNLEVGENFEIVKYPAPPLSFKTLFWLHREINRREPDLFHSLFPIVPVFYRGRLLVTVHDLQPLLMREWTGKRPYPVKKIYDMFYRWIYPYAFRKASWLISVSQATKDALTELMPELRDKTIVVHSGISPEASIEPDPAVFKRLKARYGLTESYALYMGSTRPNKNVPAMVRAFALFLKRAERKGLGGASFVMALTRDRFFADIEKSVEENGVAKNVRILDPVSQEEKFALYKNARALFFVTRLEGFGFPVLEAQSQDVPVVTSNYHSLPEIADKSALLADPDDEEGMAEALEEAFFNEELREDLIARGRENIKNFSWEKTASRVLEIYNHLI